ncbi:hypothetical protein NLI96_g2074 [Meripilus lineatus]|uniref:Major facilitator superfamily (MFS) profile domain-containing protein n=1 Tax=Meripilus lineatus TaxID=2056292 RepID=A0AAD5V9A5_9APHY|nr:hypothetical protein NLI96_g2074 [Physisporinus lineatus]
MVLREKIDSDPRPTTDITLIEVPTDDGAPRTGGLTFWLVMLTLCVCAFLSALELTCVATALPTIIEDLHGEEFVWAASAYALACTAFIPLGGDMAEAFGRPPAMLVALIIFALGSALCGSARSLPWLIGARTVQGIGGGGLLSVPQIVLADLVPLRQRGAYNGLISLTYAIAAAIGPLVGGGLAQAGQWRWLFYLNLPICGICGVLVIVFLKLRIPQGSWQVKLSRMDWIGNVLIIGSSSACSIALTWGGVVYSWRSFRVLVPLLAGLCGFGTFLLYESRVAKRPIVPFTLLSNRTSLSGYIQIFVAAIILLVAIYYVPVYYYQACKGATPLTSGVETLGSSMVIGPFAILSGLSVAKTNSYRVQCYLGWGLSIAGFGVMTLLRADSHLALGVGLPVMVASGAGILYTVTDFPVLASLPISQNARALSFYAFVRSFANAWGVTVGGSIVQNELKKRLPDNIPNVVANAGLAYSIVPEIRYLDEPLKTTVRIAFAESLKVTWQVMIGISAIGLLSCLLMRGIPLNMDVDDSWALEPEGKVEGPDSTP